MSHKEEDKSSQFRLFFSSEIFFIKFNQRTYAHTLVRHPEETTRLQVLWKKEKNKHFTTCSWILRESSIHLVIVQGGSRGKVCKPMPSKLSRN